MKLWRVWYIGVIWLLAETSIYGVVLFGPILIEAALSGTFSTDAAGTSWPLFKSARNSGLIFSEALRALGCVSISMDSVFQRSSAVGLVGACLRGESLMHRWGLPKLPTGHGLMSAEPA